MGKNPNNRAVYESLYTAWKKANAGANIRGDTLQQDMNDYWRQNRKCPKTIQAKLVELALAARTNKFSVRRFCNVQAKESESVNVTTIKMEFASAEQSADPLVCGIPSTSNGNGASALIKIDPDPVQAVESKRPKVKEELEAQEDIDSEISNPDRAPIQMSLKLQLAQVVEDLRRLEDIKSSGTVTKQDLDSLNEKTAEQKVITRKIKRLESQAARSRKYRNKQKQIVEILKEKYPDRREEIQEAMGTRPGPGRPPKK